MANVASQIIFHPTVSQGLKFGSTTTGRDKVGSSKMKTYGQDALIQFYLDLQGYPILCPLLCMVSYQQGR